MFLDFVTIDVSGAITISPDNPALKASSLTTRTGR
jgi:hypothetical protein